MHLSKNKQNYNFTKHYTILWSDNLALRALECIRAEPSSVVRFKNTSRYPSSKLPTESSFHTITGTGMPNTATRNVISSKRHEIGPLSTIQSRAYLRHRLIHEVLLYRITSGYLRRGNSLWIINLVTELFASYDASVHLSCGERGHVSPKQQYIAYESLVQG